MHKKIIGFMILGTLGVSVLLSLLMLSSGKVLATSTCTTDSATGVITCSDSVTASVVVATSCGFTKTGNGNYSGTLADNSSTEVSGTTFTTTCNTPNGYALYAVGFSDNIAGNTKLIANIGSDYDINTSSTASGSYWQMKITKPDSTVTAGTIETGYDSYTLVPDVYTKVAYYTPASGDTSTQTKFQPKYKAGASSTQPAGTYVGQVKYTLIPTTSALSKTIFELEYMQDFASLTSAQKADVLSSMITNEQYQLKDSRDEKTYYISKLTDGNVWMTQNLDFDIDSTETYTSSDTDVPSDWIPSLSTYSASTTTWGSSDTTPESYDPGDLCWNGTVNSSTTTACDQAGSHYHLGNYYNWTAAVAMNNSSSYTSEEDVNQSVCPAGWRLSTYNGDKSYANLAVMLALTMGTGGNVQNLPVYFVYGGGWAGSSNNIGSIGLYWSSVAYDNSGAHGFTLSGTGSTSQDYGGRSWGFSVRCVLR